MATKALEERDWEQAKMKELELENLIIRNKLSLMEGSALGALHQIDEVKAVHDVEKRLQETLNSVHAAEIMCKNREIRTLKTKVEKLNIQNNDQSDISNVSFIDFQQLNSGQKR